MILDKTLLLKGVAGVAAVGAAGGTYVFREQLGLVSSSSKIDAKGEEERGIPAKCITAGPSAPCELTEEELKKIKFETLEEAGVTGDVTVENFPSSSEGKLTLTIYSIDASNKRYIFNNTSSSKAITIRRGSGGSPKTVTLTAGKETKFHLNNKKLKESTVGTYGLPSFCVNSCVLTSTDLEEIKFEELNSATGTVTVSPKDKTVTLTIDSSNPKKYKFNNASGSPITIKKGTTGSEKTVTLAAGTSEYKENSDSSVLKFVEPTEANGVPTKCTTAGTDGCQLTEENLKNIKFKILEEVTTGTVTVEGFPQDNQKITLSITAASGSTKIYKFKNSGSSAVTLKKGSSGSEKTVTLEAGENDFKEDNGKLVVYEDESLKTINTKIGNLKLPESCKFKNNEKSSLTKECEVSVEELKKVEFDNKGTGDLTIETTPSLSGNIKLGIRRLKKANDSSEYSGANDDDLWVIFKDTSSKITIKGKSGSTDIVIPKKSNKELRVDVTSSKLANPYTQLSYIPQNWKVYCQEKNGNKDCTAAVDNYIWVFSGSNSETCQKVTVGNNQDIFTIAEDTDEYNLGYKFTVKSTINGSNGSPTLTANDNYEIKYSKEQKKWGFVKKNGG